MSFGGKPTTLIDQPIINDGFWPDLDVAELQRGYRLPAEYLLEFLADGIGLAMGEVINPFDVNTDESEKLLCACHQLNIFTSAKMAFLVLTKPAHYD